MTEERTWAGFVPQFWIINFIELLERGAFYGALSFAAVYLDGLGYSGGTLGLLLAMATTLPYVISVASGPLAEKFGYQPMTVLAFVGYSMGYVLLALFQTTAMIALALTLVGFGSGLFKAIPAACITHLTPESKRNLGFVVYYWMINMGAFLAPIGLAYAVLSPAGYDLGAYRLAFFVVGGISAVAFGVSLFFFRNPSPPARETSLSAAFRPMLDVIRDTRFTGAAAIYVGFFVLYVMNFTYLTIYLNDFVALPDWFPVTITNSINPFTIILLAVPLGALMARFHPLRMMSVGLMLFTAGFFILGFSGVFWGMVIGVVLASIGEFLTQPGFLSYVSRIAPKDRVAIYQSMGFLPIALGYFIGSFIGGPVYAVVAEKNGQPELFWAIVTSVGLVTLSGFLYLASRLEAHDAGKTRIPNRQRALTAMPLLVILLSIGVAAAIAPSTPEEVTGDLGSWHGHLEESEAWTQTLNLTGIGVLTLGLSWTDEALPGGGLTPVQNAPDRFRILLLDENGTTLDTATDDDGRILLDWTNIGAVHQVTVEVRLLDAGDDRIGQVTVATDTGNDWSLRASYRTVHP